MLMEDSANEVSDFYLGTVKTELFTSNTTSHLGVVKTQSWSMDSCRLRAQFVDLNQRYLKRLFWGEQSYVDDKSEQS